MSIATAKHISLSSHSHASDQTPRRIVICGGGTAGHVTPGIAIAEAFREDNFGSAVTFLGHGDPFLQDLVTEAGFHWETVSAAPWSEQALSTRLRSLTRITSGVVKVRQILKRLGAQLVLGLGGHASVSGVLAARSLGIPIALFEPNVEPGLANRWLGRISNRIFLGHPSTAQFFRGIPTDIAGIPIRRDIVRSTASKNNVRRQSELHVLVTGGSLGSEFLNRYAPALLNRVAASFDSVRITHQVGRHDRVPVERAYDSPSVTARVVNQIQKMDTVYDDVDCVISAGGAITLAELNALSVPTVVVPLEWATHDHQADNAEQFVTGHPDRRWVRETTFGAADLQTWITARLRERVVSARSSQHGLCEAGSVRQTGQVSRQIAEELREVIIAAENPQSP